MKIEASKRTHVSAQKALTAAVETAIIIPEISERDSRIRCPGVCASRLYFLLHFHNRSFESVRGCHAPVLGRQGTAEMRRRAPTYRERWVKNDDSGTLGFLFFQNQNAVQSGTAFSFYTIIEKSKFFTKRGRAMRACLTPSVTAAPCQLPRRGSSFLRLFSVWVISCAVPVGARIARPRFV